MKKKIIILLGIIVFILIASSLFSILYDPYKKFYSFNLPEKYQLIDTFESGSSICLDACLWIKRTYIINENKDDTKNNLIPFMHQNGYTVYKLGNLGLGEQEVWTSDGKYKRDVLIFENNEGDNIEINITSSVLELPRNKREITREPVTVVTVHQSD